MHRLQHRQLGIDGTQKMSLAKMILASGRPFIFFHTWTVGEELLDRAIREQKSMDLDVCIDDAGRPYLGHSREYHDKTGEPYFDSLPIWEVVDRIAKSNIPVLIDCKHYGAWPVVEEVVAKIGPERCMVDTYVFEFKFGYSRTDTEPDILAEWMPIHNLFELKIEFPSVTTTACIKWPPPDMLLSAKYSKLVEFIREVMKENRIDTACLSVPDSTITDEWIRYFSGDNIIVRVGIDRTDASKLAEIYIGETDDLRRASKSMF
jgi:hypothetical protein